MSDKVVFKLVTPVGNCSALNTVSNLMAKCLLIRPSEVVMMLSTHFSQKLVLENTSQEPSSLTLNPQSLTKSELVPIGNSSTQSN